MDFGKVLTRAWEIIWKHKILWLFGLFAGCSGQRAGINFNFGGGGGGPSYQFDEGDIPYFPPQMYRLFMEAERFIEENIEAILAVGIGLIILVIILVVGFFLLGALGKIGLIKGTLLAEGGAEKMTFNEIFEATKPFFWRIVGLNLLVVLGWVVVAIILWIIFVGGIFITLGFGLCLLLPLICLLIPVGWFLMIVVEQANLALVLEDLDIFAAIERGWNFTREHLGNMIVMGLILFVGGAIITFVIGLPQLFSVIPLISSLVRGEFFTDFEAMLRGLGTTVGLALLYMPIFLALRAVLVSYIQSAWTLNYLENKGELDVGGSSPPQLEEPAAA
jgi:hypothetical protein